MNEKDREYLTKKILDEWISLPSESRPWGIWIVEYEPLPENSDSLTTNVINSWFLSNDGIKKMGAWCYVRYYIVQSGEFWCKCIYPPPRNITNGSLKYDIGLSGFAEFEDTKDLYLECQFGSIFGKGYRFFRKSNGMFIKKDLWIS